uniref:uncharacterized protein LOC120326258 isoform X1 n=1 Tax=Styela clava TaxID=7725 RepID=UPI001939E6F5|nr:uncharacterized protein LOC120326258 isoform X1 [Styela clava]
MFRLFELTVVAVLMCYVTHAFCRTCEKSWMDDIDWQKVNEKTWFDVVDVPHIQKPLGCWNFENFTVTEDEITAAVWESSIGRINSHRLRLVRGSQFYRALEYNVPTFQSLYDDFEKQNRKIEPQQVLDEETQKYLDAEWTFLTDYENYFIIVLNFESDWGAFVKAPSPQITVEQLQMISNVLVANELPVSTMVLKNECVREQDLSRNPTTIVLMN